MLRFYDNRDTITQVNIKNRKNWKKLKKCAIIKVDSILCIVKVHQNKIESWRKTV